MNQVEIYLATEVKELQEQVETAENEIRRLQQVNEALFDIIHKAVRDINEGIEEFTTGP